MFFYEHRWYNGSIFRSFLINSLKNCNITFQLVSSWTPVGI